MPREGMLLQVDGSRHRWFGPDLPFATLVAGIDDATGRVPGGTFRAAEDAVGYFTTFAQTAEHHGLPGAVYSDRHGIFIVERNRPPTLAEQLTGKRSFTQVGRALEEAGIGWIGAHSAEAKGRVERLWGTFGDRLVTELRLASITTIVDGGTLQLGLFDERNLAEISSPDFPGERLVVCRNPALRAERARKREDLLRATEALLAPIVARVEAGTLRGAARIGLALGRVIDRHKVAKHFELDIADDRLVVRRKETEIAAEAALDGLYVLRTSVAASRLDSPSPARFPLGCPRLQAPDPGRARLPRLQGGRSRRPPDPPLRRGPGPGPHLPVPARVLRPVAPRAGLGAPAVSRRGAAGGNRPGRPGPALGRRPRQGPHP
jgi:hypothetical protein